MKTSSTPRPLKRATALNCLLVNQLATPGLGSLMGRRISAGLVQLALALAGFGCVMGWFIQLFSDTYRQFSDLPSQPKPYPWIGTLGLILVVSSWLLSWITSLSLLREAQRNEPNSPPIITVPPLIK
ncbi:MAG: hypothetical protein JWR69_3910 [Pedosphaera sp.]|nr:hypothetical protein [Pedosphaera sp.]